MAEITKDYRMTVTDPEGIVILDMSLSEYNLDKSIACSSITSDIKEAIEINETAHYINEVAIHEQTKSLNETTTL